MGPLWGKDFQGTWIVFACAGLMRCMVRYIEVFASTEADLEASKRTGDSNVQRMNDDDPHYQVCCLFF